jgi:alpha-maltose-1-phosphate synthase
MKITITTPAKFPAAFASARYLEKAGHLERIVSPVPYQRSRRFGVSRERTAGLTPLGIWDYAFQHWGPQAVQQRHQLAFSAGFDEVAAHMLGESDVVNCWCSTALRTIRAAHRRGVPAVLEVASAHIVAQAELIREESRRFGSHDRRELVSPGVVARTVAEYREADLIVVTSSFVRRTFTEQGVPPSKIIVIPYGVDPSPAPRRKTHGGSPRILFVGGCSLRKGIPYLIEAFKQLRTPATLRLVGRANEDLFRRVGGLPAGVEAVGPKTGAALAEEYAHAEVFVLPSVEDGFGLVTLEAMNAGLPVIVSDHAGSAEVVRDGANGFVVPARDAGALATLLDDLLSDPARRARMGANARATAEARTWDTYGDERHERVYAPLFESVSGRSADAQAA